MRTCTKTSENAFNLLLSSATAGPWDKRQKARKQPKTLDLPLATKRFATKSVKQLTGDDLTLRATTLSQIKRFALPEALELICSRLRQFLLGKDEVLRGRAFEVLLLLGPQAFWTDRQPRTSGLLALLNHSDVEHRLSALRYVSGLLLQGSVLNEALARQIQPVLLRALHDPDGTVRQEAAKLVSRLGSHAEPVLQVLEQHLREQGEELPRHMVLPRMVLGPKPARPSGNTVEPGQKPARQ